MNYISKVGLLDNVILIENIVHKFSHIHVYKVCVTDSKESERLAWPCWQQPETKAWNKGKNDYGEQLRC